MNKALIVSIIGVLLLLTGIAAYRIYTTEIRQESQKLGQVDVNTTSTQTPRRDETAEQTVSDFYSEYENCMKNPPAPAAGRVSQYCQENNSQIASNFVDNLATGGVAAAGADPITCSQNTGQTFNPGQSQVQGDSATVPVTATIGTLSQTIRVDLVKENGTWRVSNVICPAP